jgi:hypothetical protein
VLLAHDFLLEVSLMTATEMVEMLHAIGPQEPHIYFFYIAERIYEARLKNGEPLVEVIDVIAWLRELGEVVKAQSHLGSTRLSISANGAAGNGTRPTVIRSAQKRWDETCPRCGHIHQGISECGVDCGGGRICRCEMAVPA